MVKTNAMNTQGDKIQAILDLMNKFPEHIFWKAIKDL